MALWATLLCLPFGILVGWLLARREFRGKFLVEALVQLRWCSARLPVCVAPAARHAGPIGRWLYEAFGITLAFNWKGAVIASAVMAFPLLVQPCESHFA